jgi:hypothetical protein
MGANRAPAASCYGESESLLAVKVERPPTLAPEVRDRSSILDLVMVAPDIDFVATAEVRYDGHGRPPPESAEPAAMPLRASQPTQPQDPRPGRQGASRRIGR